MLEEQHEKEKEAPAVTKVKMSGSEKKKSEQEHVLHFLHKTGNQRKPGSFWKFYVVVVQNNGKKCTKKCAARAKLLFLLIRPIVVFSPSSLLSPLSITRLYILYEH